MACMAHKKSLILLLLLLLMDKLNDGIVFDLPESDWCSQAVIIGCMQWHKLYLLKIGSWVGIS